MVLIPLHSVSSAKSVNPIYMQGIPANLSKILPSDINPTSLLYKLPIMKGLTKTLGIHMKEIVPYFNNYMRKHLTASLFEYYITPSGATYNAEDIPDEMTLIEKNVIYTEQYDKKAQKTITTRYDLYIGQNNYIHLTANDAVLELLMNHPKFKHIFTNKNFMELRRKYAHLPDELVNLIKKDIQLSNIPNHYELLSLTPSDIVNIYNGKEDMTVIKSLFKVYTEDYGKISLYLSLPDLYVASGVKYTQAVSIPFEAITTKDFSLVENCEVFSIPKPDMTEEGGRNHNNFFSGKQCEAPYWEANKITISLLKNCITA